MYIKLPNIYPYSTSQLRADNPDVSFPSEIPNERLADWSIYLVSESPAPIPQSGQIVEEAFPVEVDGLWTQQWILREANEAEIAAKAAEVRAERNQLLSESDWTQLPDAPVDASLWAAYRQELRDVTSQQDFPFAVVYPNKP